MRDSLSATLSTVAHDMLMDLAFLMPGEPLSPTEAAGFPIVASVDFQGPCKGRLWLSASRGVLCPLAANMLGLDDDQRPTEEQQIDAIKELLNVIGGNLLPVMTSPEDVYELLPPSLHPDRIDVPAGGNPAATASVLLEEGQVDLAVFINERAG